MKKFSYDIISYGDGVYLIDEHYSTMTVIVGSEKALVIDCGAGVGDFKKVIEEITDLPYQVVLTHSHVDHCGGRGQFDDIYCSKKDEPYIKEVTLKYRKLYAFICRFSLNCHFSKLAIKPTEKEPSVHIIGEAYKFFLGDRVVTVYETPGHTVGSLAFYDDKSKILFIGDVLNEMLLMFLPHATTITEMAQTHRKILSLPEYEKVWSSHHTEPQTREEMAKLANETAEILQKHKKNLPIPLAIHKGDAGAVVYRMTKIN